MTTYPLSEPATIYAAEPSEDGALEVLAQGTLEECADIVASLSSDRQRSVSIQMDELELKFGPQEIGELLRFLRDESAGLSNNEIADIKSPDR